MTISINDGVKTVTGEHIRLVYMGKKHITTIEGTARSTTWTKWTVEELRTKQECDDRIDELKLETDDGRDTG